MKKVIKDIIEFPFFVILAAGMVLGPAFWYVIGAVVAMFGLGIVVGGYNLND